MAGNPALGRRLKQLRGYKTQDEVATVIGISRARYSHYETGRSEPDNEVLQALAKYYAVTVDFLLGLDKTPKLNEFAVPDGAEQKNAVFLLESQREIKIYRLTPKDRDEIFAPENIVGSQLVLADSIYTKGFKAIDNSMSGSQIIAGTHVLIEEDSPVDGEIVVAQVPGNAELLIRRYTTANDEITLLPDNSNYKPQTFRAKDVRIIGIVTELRINLGRKSK